MFYKLQAGKNHQTWREIITCEEHGQFRTIPVMGGGGHRNWLKQRAKQSSRRREKAPQPRPHLRWSRCGSGSHNGRRRVPAAPARHDFFCDIFASLVWIPDSDLRCGTERIPVTRCPGKGERAEWNAAELCRRRSGLSWCSAV